MTAPMPLYCSQNTDGSQAEMLLMQKQKLPLQKIWDSEEYLEWENGPDLLLQSILCPTMMIFTK